MKYKILGSSSKGNSVIIDNIMFDVGIPYSKIEPHLKDIDYIFITHKHSDHFKISNLEKIKRYYPNIKTIGNYSVAYQYPLDYIVNHDHPFELDNYSVFPFECPHGSVVCTGFSFTPLNKITTDCKSFIFATDTNSMENAPKQQYDYFFLESNYDENKLKHYIDCPKYGSHMIEGSLRHLSTQKCLEFFYSNRKPSSQLIELHKSSRFY